MGKKNKIPRDIKLHLEALAKRLKPIKVADAYFQVSGQQLLDKAGDKKVKDTDNKPIVADSLYTLEDKRGHCVNHFKKLKEIFLAKGIPGVEEYVKANR